MSDTVIEVVTDKDYMDAILMASSVIFALTPVFFGFIISKNLTFGDLKSQIFFYGFCILPLVISFVAGLYTILNTTAWFHHGVSDKTTDHNYSSAAVALFLVQTFSFMVGTVFYLFYFFFIHKRPN